MEIFSKSGKKVSWNLEGKSLNSEIMSSSSSSSQLYCDFFWVVCGFLTAGVWVLEIGFLDLDSLVSFFNWVLMVLAVLSVGWILVIGVLDWD